jgi:hypothetical protein
MMKPTFKRALAAVTGASLLLLAACGGDDSADNPAGQPAEEVTDGTTVEIAEQSVIEQPDVEAYTDDTGTAVASFGEDTTVPQAGFTVWEYDDNADGVPDAYSVDRWNDGVADIFCRDSDNNGVTETCFVDLNNSSRFELLMGDQTQDTVFDGFMLDSNEDGVADSAHFDRNQNSVLDSAEDPSVYLPDRGYSIVGGVPTNPDWFYSLMMMGAAMGAGVTYPPGDSDGDGTFDNHDDCSWPGAYSNFGC